MKFACGEEVEEESAEMDQILTVRSRQAEANVLVSFGLNEIFMM